MQHLVRGKLFRFS